MKYSSKKTTGSIEKTLDTSTSHRIGGQLSMKERLPIITGDSHFVGEVGRCLLSSSMGSDAGVQATCKHFAGITHASNTKYSVPQLNSNEQEEWEISFKREKLCASIRLEVEKFLLHAGIKVLHAKLYQQREQNKKLLEALHEINVDNKVKSVSSLCEQTEKARRERAESAAKMLLAASKETNKLKTKNERITKIKRL